MSKNDGALSAVVLKLYVQANVVIESAGERPMGEVLLWIGALAAAVVLVWVIGGIFTR
jgi:hypothetical protein